MSGYSNFETDNKKFTKDRYDVQNSEFNSFYNKDKNDSDKINKLDQNQKKFTLWASFFLKYPDIFIDIITPEDSGFKLYAYQRIMLRFFF